MSGSTENCQRCGKGFVGPSCPFCTVTGVDLEALLNAEEMKLLRSDDMQAPVSLVDMVSGKAFGVMTPLCKIGRDLANDIPLAGDRSMSRFHCQIRQSGADFVIEDCGSRNGTFLNGSPIATARKLQNGDIVSAGVSRYRFSLKSPEEIAQEAAFGSGSGSGEPTTGLASSGASTELVASSGASTSFVSQNEIDEAREALQKLRGTVKQPEAGQTDEPSAWLGTAQGEAADASAGPLEKSISPESVDSTKNDAKQADKKSSPTKMPPKDDHTKAAAAALFGDPNAPAWVDEYVLPELQKLMGEKERLNGLLEEIRQDIKQIDRKIAATQSVSQALLSATGPELGQACKQVFDALEWQTEHSFNNPCELNLKRDPKVEAVVRVVVSQGDPTMKDFEALVNQQAVVWCQSNYEPKGIMIVQTRPDLPPKERPILTRDFLENMRRKKICIVHPAQLLAMYRLVLHNGHDKNYFKEMLTTTCGALPGFLTKPQDAATRPAATA